MHCVQKAGGGGGIGEEDPTSPGGSRWLTCLISAPLLSITYEGCIHDDAP